MVVYEPEVPHEPGNCRGAISDLCLSPPDAIVLCGGAGLRLREVTGDEPKAMARIGNRPFLELLLNQLGGMVASA